MGDTRERWEHGETFAGGRRIVSFSEAVAVGLGSEQRARVHAFAGHKHTPRHHESPPHGYKIGYSPRNISYAGAVHISKFVVPVRVRTSRGHGREDLSQVDNLVNSCALPQLHPLSRHSHQVRRML